ncbi:MAG: rhodanese-like domain-containing protein, partial [Tissierellia bacterium]|nr:rhodanese-like domain-containing protein [Tissierellia bacterium]
MEKEQTGTETEYKKISAQEAKAIIESEDVIILDVRTQEEYNEGHIENS